MERLRPPHREFYSLSHEHNVVRSLTLGVDPYAILGVVAYKLLCDQNTR